MGKITEIVDLKVTQSGDEKSVKSLRGEIEKAKLEAITLAREFGKFSPQAIDATKRVAELKKEMGDFQQRVAGLSPEKFQVIANVASGVASGFAAAQGAMVLLGAESEDLQKTMVKLQAVMALSQGIQGITNLKQSFGSLVGYLRNSVIPMFTTVAGAARALGAATGIGLIVTAVGFLITKFEALKRMVKNAIENFPILGAIISAISNTVSTLVDWFFKLTDAIGLTNTALDAEIEKLDEANKKMSEEIDIMEAAGASAATLYAKRRGLIEAELVALRKAGTEKEKIREKELELIKLDAAEAKRVQDDLDAADEKRAADQKARRDKAIAEQKAWHDKVLDEQKRFLDAFGAVEDAFRDANAGAEKRDRETEEARQQRARDEAEKKRAGEAARKKFYHDREMAQIKALQDAKQFAFDSTSQLLGATAGLFAQGAAAQKAFAIAQVAFDEARAISATIAGATAAAAAGGPAAPFLLAGYIASGLASVFAAFKSVKAILGESGGTAATSTSPRSFAQPIISGQLPGSDQTGAAMQFGQVYVLEGDITKTQGRVRTNKNVAVV